MSIPILKTENLLLRPLSKDDSKLLWPYVSNPEISKNMSWHPHKNVDETVAFINGVVKSMDEGKNITWCIFFNGTFCGIFSLISIIRTHRALRFDRAELAYWLGEEFQGKGIMVEAGKKIIDFAFKELSLHKLIVAHHLNNEKSKNLILRLGFNFFYEESKAFMKDGEWIDCRLYQLTYDEYLKNKSEK